MRKRFLLTCDCLFIISLRRWTGKTDRVWLEANNMNLSYARSRKISPVLAFCVMFKLIIDTNSLFCNMAEELTFNLDKMIFS